METQFYVTVHGHSMPAHCNRILPMLRIPNRQNPLPPLYCTEFSVQKIPTIKSNHILQKHFTLSPVVSLWQLYYNTIRDCLREK